MDTLMNVQVMKAPVRKEPSFLSPVLGTLAYAEKVRTVTEKDGWVEIKAEKGALTGWMHASALTTKTVVLNPGDADVKKAVSTNEYALAGKGFNESVEKEYRSKNPSLNFEWINKMEAFIVTQDKMKDFLQKGELI